MPDEHEGGKGAREYRIVAEPVWKDLDPELQHVIITKRASPPTSPLLDEAPQAVDVIAKLRDPRMKVEGLHVVKEIGLIVTGTVDADKIEDVRRHENVISLKAARRLRPNLSTSVPDIMASRQQLKEAFPDDPKPLDGANVIVGIIDHGCDFSHPNFRKPDARTPGGATRVLFLWDQRGGPEVSRPVGGGRSPAPYGYGREFYADAINEALREAPPTPANPAAPHDYLNYIVSHSLHGTAVMDIAAGNGGDGGLPAPGVAPAADIIFVDSHDREDFMTGDPVGDSRHLLEAVAYVFDKARELGRPAVVNISLGGDSGPHDGTTLVEQGFDCLLETPERAIVIAAGNLRIGPDERRVTRHVRRTLHPRRAQMLRWRIFEDIVGGNNNNRAEVWYDGGRALSLILRSPRGDEIGPFPLGSTYTIRRNGGRAGFVFHRADDPTNGDNNIVVLFTPRMEAGVWELELRLLDDGSQLPIEAHAWTVSDRQRSLFLDMRPSDDTCTLSSIACGNSTIVVGGYHHSEPGKPKLRASGEGPTRDGRLKPEVSAPASQITVAQATPTTSLTRLFGSGTSAAAPHVAGVIALLMQAADRPLFVEEIREFIISAARDDPPSPEHGWDTCYGDGRVSAVGALRALRRIPLSKEEATDGSSLDVGPAFRAADVNDINGATPDALSAGAMPGPEGVNGDAESVFAAAETNNDGQ